MGIAGLSLPNTASMENLHGGGQSHPFNSAGAIAACNTMCDILNSPACDTMSPLT